LNNNRNVIVYLPPSYTENTLKVYSNVLVMHDGQNLFDPATAFLGNAWMIQDTLDPLIYNGEIEEVLVIGAWNTADRMNEYTYSFDPSEGFGGKGDLYLDFVEQTLLPLMQEKLRIKLDKGGRLGMMGSSLGGLISCYAGWKRPQVYGRVGCMSSSF
jgi:predicted alpha/beta superfamily hydrolase